MTRDRGGVGDLKKPILVLLALVQLAMTNSIVPFSAVFCRANLELSCKRSKALEKWSLSTRMAPQEMTTIACPKSIPISPNIVGLLCYRDTK